MEFDFISYMDKYIDKDIYQKFLDKESTVLQKLATASMNGWQENTISDEEVKSIKELSTSIRNNSDIFLVIGIGGFLIWEVKH